MNLYNEQKLLSPIKVLTNSIVWLQEGRMQEAIASLSNIYFSMMFTSYIPYWRIYSMNEICFHQSRCAQADEPLIHRLYICPNIIPFVVICVCVCSCIDIHTHTQSSLFISFNFFPFFACLLRNSKFLTISFA